MVYAREFDGQAHDFGVIGVEKGTLTLYDAQSRSHWSQLFGEAISGTMQGTRVEKLSSTMTTWDKWKALHPSTTVYVKPSIPYKSRYNREAFASIATMDDGPIRNEDLIVGVEGHIEAKAYPVRRLAQSGHLVNDTIESASTVVYLSQDLATAKIFRRTVDGQTLTFGTNDADELVDAQTGTRWDPLSGTALEGPLAGKQLQPIVSTYALWFAWKKYRPDTMLYGETPEDTAGAQTPSAP